MNAHFKLALSALLSALLLAPAACGDADVDSPDGRDEVAFVDGKADANWGECELDSVLALVNDPATSADDLKDGGVHSRAANNIIDARNGDDGEAGTNDDVAFESVRDIDDVFYVGPVALDQLVALVADRCIIAATQTEVIFSPQDYEDSHLARIAELIDGAQHSLDIAMYSFSDGRMYNVVERAANRGVSIRMIFEPAQSDRLDPQGTRSARLEAMGIDVRYVNKIMHHKYVIIDGPRGGANDATTDSGIIATGSGNWSTSAATRYDENTVIIYGNTELNLRFQHEFNTLWNHSRDFEFEEEFTYFESTDIDPALIPDDPTTDAAFTSANFDQRVSSRWGNTFTRVRGRDEISDRIVESIEGAEDSIWIASGFMRSRPIAEALMAKWDTNPDIDIKIYLDGKEYVSDWAHYNQVDELEQCLAEAQGSEARTEDCEDKGYYWSWDLHHAGIPVRFKTYSYRWHYRYAAQMHHKYLIIDGDTVISGSYNLSSNAEHNTIENMVWYHASGFPDLVQGFKQNFVDIWDTGDGKYDGLMDEIQNGTGRVPIVFDSMAIRWDQVRDLRDAINDACVDVNSYSFRRNPERHFTCSRD
jgi:phosphatidylserine/phosphatidylglycerophosphate/cardiolipin synthase-like enzyme